MRYTKVFYSLQEFGIHDVSKHSAVACLLVFLTLFCNALTSQIQQVHVTPVFNQRLDVTPRDVITQSSSVECESTCRQTSWCTSANMAPDRSTCQLLSEEVPDMTSLESAEGWTYLREYYLDFTA